MLHFSPMQQQFKSTFWFTIALLSAIWFALTSWIWVYYFNLFISFPFGIAGFFIWKKWHKSPEESRRYAFVKWVLMIGVASSLLFLIGLLLFN
jgi:hypothetical protein